MAFDFMDWKDRISKRNDITSMLTHLTRPSNDFIYDENEEEMNLAAVDNLIKILKERCLVGSDGNGYVLGNIPAVCFQDAPLYGVIQNIQNEENIRNKSKYNKIRYTGNGLTFSKFYIYGKGGRPAIYDNSKEAKKYLPIEQYWRIVNLELNTDSQKIVDWMHEREWRVSGEFEFDYEFTHVLLYDKAAYDYFMDNCDDCILQSIHGITMLKSMLM
jgi:hypothetical protein